MVLEESSKKRALLDRRVDHDDLRENRLAR